MTNDCCLFDFILLADVLEHVSWAERANFPHLSARRLFGSIFTPPSVCSCRADDDDGVVSSDVIKEKKIRLWSTFEVNFLRLTVIAKKYTDYTG